MNESNVNPEGGGDARSSAWYVVHKLLDLPMSAACMSQAIAEERRATIAKVLSKTQEMKFDDFETRLLSTEEHNEMEAVYNNTYGKLVTLEARIAAAKAKHGVE